MPRYCDYIPSDSHEFTVPKGQLTPGLKPGVGRLEDSFNKFLRGKMSSMQLVGPTILLFALNLLDGLLTIIWVGSGVATESHQLMGPAPRPRQRPLPFSKDRNW